MGTRLSGLTLLLIINLTEKVSLKKKTHPVSSLEIVLSFGSYLYEGSNALFLLVDFALQIRGSGVFELGLNKFTNDLGLNSNSDCCSGIRTTSTGPCSSQCRTFFRICLKEYQTHISLDTPCTFGSLQTPVLGANSFHVPPRINSTFRNPIALPFPFKWPVSIGDCIFTDFSV